MPISSFFFFKHKLQLSQILYLHNQFFETRNGELNLISVFWLIYLKPCHRFESCFFFLLYYLCIIHKFDKYICFLSSSESQMKTMEKEGLETVLWYIPLETLVDTRPFKKPHEVVGPQPRNTSLPSSHLSL